MNLSLAQWRPTPFQWAARGPRYEVGKQIKSTELETGGLTFQEFLSRESFIKWVFLSSIFYVTLPSSVWLQFLYSYKDWAFLFLCLPTSHNPWRSCNESVKGGLAEPWTRPNQTIPGQTKWNWARGGQAKQLRADQAISAKNKTTFQPYPA